MLNWEWKHFVVQFSQALLELTQKLSLDKRLLSVLLLVKSSEFKTHTSHFLEMQLRRKILVN